MDDPLDVGSNPADFTSDIQTCIVMKEEQQDWSCSPDQEDPEPPHIKDEHEDPEPPHIKEEQEDAEPPHIKDEQENKDDPQPPHIKEDQEDPEPPHIKEDQDDPEPPHIKEEVSTGQEGGQLQGLQGILFTFTPVTHQQEAQSSQLHQRQTERMETEDCGGPEPGGETDVVADLLTAPFSQKTFEEKREIVKNGRPTPQLAALTKPGKTFVRHFQTANYERYSWLTASEKTLKLYCWECLLFATERLAVWSHVGFANLGCLTKAALRHQITAGHLQATVLLKMFGEARVDLQINQKVRRETELHNEKVKKNREILKRLIDCVIFLGKQELSFRRQDQHRDTTNKGNYVELLSFVAERDTDLHFHLSTNKVFTGPSGKMQDDLIGAVAEVMGEEIRREVSQAPFVAVMVDETTDASNAARLALALRYVTDAGVRERFVRFDDVAGRKSADDVAALLVRFLEDHGCLDKVVAQSYDGAAVAASGLNAAQDKVKEKAPTALFLHCYAHRLNSVLTRGVSKLRECNIFFAHLNGLAAYFSGSPTRTRLLDDVCRRRLPGAAPTPWRCGSGLVDAVFEKRAALRELFQLIVERHDEFDDESVRCADGYRAHLEDFGFCFLLSAFRGIFGGSDVLFFALQNRHLDAQFCLRRVDEFCDAVESEKGRFADIFESTEREAGAPSGRAEGGARERYQKLHGDIVDNVLAQVRNRFKDHEKLTFLSLLDPGRFRAYRKKFPESAFSDLTRSHGRLFEDLPRLKTELTVMYAMAGFEGKGPADLLAFLRQNNLVNSMRQLHALACLAVTMPTAAAGDQRTFSAPKRIEVYCRNGGGGGGEARPTSLAAVAIEKDLVLELKRRGKLYDRVIELFASRERRADFVFK